MNARSPNLPGTLVRILFNDVALLHFAVSLDMECMHDLRIFKLDLNTKSNVSERAFAKLARHISENPIK